MTDLETELTQVKQRLHRLEDLLAHMIVVHSSASALCPGGREKAFLLAQTKRQITLEEKHIDAMKQNENETTD